ncbi:NADH-quinone oxidoreductase subunit H [Dyella sp. KRB-257]|uniref:NADH-quinone oxidoreductase subunit H n=1 Tax=Dyella sp. KRB-257 TaxID=3400915 RepID=UPI003C126451
MSVLVPWLGMLALLCVGMTLVVMLDRLVFAAIARRPRTSMRDTLLAPLRTIAATLVRQQNRTEHPDRLNWALAPVLYLGLAGIGLAVVPLAPGVAVIDSPASVVLWGAAEALTVIAVFLHGWSANAPLPLLGAYRYAALSLPIMLLSMFVLIGTALPAQSLSVTRIVESQHEVWNVWRQPLGLLLFLLLGLSLSLRGPFDYADSTDLAGGTASEVSGAARLTWQLARHAMLVAFAAMASSAFLGGYLGPVRAGPWWLALKMLVLLTLLIGAGHGLARLPPSRMLTLLWTVLLPLAFLDLGVAGVVALW